jgi:hypothetical protein
MSITGKVVFDDCLGGVERERTAKLGEESEREREDGAGVAWRRCGCFLTGWRLAESGEPSKPNKWTTPPKLSLLVLSRTLSRSALRPQAPAADVFNQG